MAEPPLSGMGMAVTAVSAKPNLIGVAGEYYVLSELLRHGYIAALAPAGVPNADIVVTDVEGSRLCAIQVKTRRGVGADGGWHMKAKHEKIRADRLFYCFVDFLESKEARATVYVMPSAVVADAITIAHRAWLKTPGRKGQPHKDGEMRRLLPDYRREFGTQKNPYPSGWLNAYRYAWNLLKLESSDPTHPAPVLTR
jgi:hypothetical protein